MFKKFGVVTALAGTFLLTTAFSSPAHAQSIQGQSNGHPYKIYYSVHSNCGHLSQQDIQGYLNKFMKNHHVNWNEIKSNQQAQPKTNEKTQTSSGQQHAQAQPQPESNQTQVQQQAQPKQQQAQPQPKVYQQQTKTQAQPSQQQAQPKSSQTQAKAQDQTKSNQSGYQLSQFEQQVVKLTNQQRTQHGLKPLKVNLALSKMARDKSQDMANKHYFSHQSPTYGSPFDMMKEYGISFSSAGENIAEGQQTPQEVVNAWMHSPGHRANILNSSYTEIGVGYVANGNIWTQDFIGK